MALSAIFWSLKTQFDSYPQKKSRRLVRVKLGNYIYFWLTIIYYMVKRFFSLRIIPIVLEMLYDILFMCVLHFMFSFISRKLKFEISSS